MKKIVNIFCCLVLLLVLTPQFVIQADAATTTAATKGKCGDGLNWTFSTSSGALTITGTGRMYDYSYYGDTPWAPWRSYIKSVSIHENVESIGNNAFSYCYYLTKVSFLNPSSGKLTAIGADAL